MLFEVLECVELVYVCWLRLRYCHKLASLLYSSKETSSGLTLPANVSGNKK